MAGVTSIAPAVAVVSPSAVAVFWVLFYYEDISPFLLKLIEKGKLIGVENRLKR
jgi:hypothetical protein